MSQEVYPLTLAEFIGDVVGGNPIKIALLDSTYVYSDGHDFYDDVSAALLGTAATVTNPDFTGGILDGDRPVLYSGVTTLDTVTQAVVFIDTGVAGTSRVLAHIERNADGTMMNFTPATNADILVDWPLGLLLSI